MSELERLREAFTARGAFAGENCAPAERIFDAATGALPPQEAREMLAHNLDCADCAAAWCLARELLVESGLLPAEAEPEPLPRRWQPFAIAAGLAAAAAFLLVPLARHDEPPAPVTRAPRSPALRQLSPESLPRSNFLLRWSGAPAGARYTLTVTTRDLTRIHELSGVAQPEARVPEKALAGVRADQVLVWTVEALLPDGQRLVSPAFLVRLE